MEHCNQYPPAPLPISSTSLLLTNHQINADVAVLITRQEKAQTLVYKLDCLILAESDIYPTWLSIPCLSESIETIQVNIRVVSHCGDDSFDQWYSCNGMIWSLYTLLRRFLLRGPDFLGPSLSTRNKSINVGEIVLNIVTPAATDVTERAKQEYTEPTEADQADLAWRHHEAPMAAAEAISSYLEYLLGDGRWTAEYRNIVYQRVRVIRFLLDGREQKTWHLIHPYSSWETPMGPFTAHVPGKDRCVLRRSEEMELANPPTITDIDLHLGAIKP